MICKIAFKIAILFFFILGLQAEEENKKPTPPAESKASHEKPKPAENEEQLEDEFNEDMFKAMKMSKTADVLDSSKYGESSKNAGSGSEFTEESTDEDQFK